MTNHDDALYWKNRALKAEERVRELENGLMDAREALMSWGGYVGSYFKEKHDLDGDLEAIEKLIPDRITRP